MHYFPKSIVKNVVTAVMLASMCFAFTGCNKNPDSQPQITPTPVVTVAPTSRPTATPTPRPTATPTPRPTATPAPRPTATPTPQPTATPTPRPTATPTPRPTATPYPYTVEVSTEAGAVTEGIYICPQEEGNLHSFTITAGGSAATGYAVITINDRQYTTVQIENGRSITVNVKAKADTKIEFTAVEGVSDLYEDGLTDQLIEDGETILYTFAGLKISVIGDSISTYHGWSDAYPIADENRTNRYGEAYYGPAGGDFHNTELLVTDTWWHQAATQLGAEILMSNAGNSTGIVTAYYPSIPAWHQYLADLRGYDSRPYYMGKDGKNPDIIAIYLGSADMSGAKAPDGTKLPNGSVAEIDFDTLIVKNADGSYTYAQPATVAEGYCIMLHKMQVTYPDAEIYCFTSVPNSGGELSTGNNRLLNTIPYNAMVKEVAAYHGLAVVDLMEAFGLDPDGDGVAVQADWDRFKTYFNGDPHPNALGFDVITEKFVKTVLAESKYN